MSPVVTVAIGLVALLYAAVGHAGATGYTAVMALAGLPPATIRPTALVLNVLVAAIATIVLFGRVNWVAMVVIVTLLGTDHPPIHHEGEPLGPGRTLLGVASFIIPVVTFMPEPLVLN